MSRLEAVQRYSKMNGDTTGRYLSQGKLAWLLTILAPYPGLLIGSYGRQLVRLAVGATTVLPARGRPPEAAARRLALRRVEEVVTNWGSSADGLGV